MPQLTIERFDGAADARALASCHYLVQECIRADQPDQAQWSLGAFGAKWVEGFSGSPQETWFAADDGGAIVGCYLLTLHDRENLSMASVVLRVAPDRRRAGIGTALLRHCEGRATAAGRTRLTGESWDGTSGAAFAKAIGASPGIPEVHRRLPLTNEVRGRLPGLRKEAEERAAGYSLLSWVGPTPEERLEKVAAVHAAMEDAPRDAGVEHRVWDADRIRRLEQLAAEHGVIHHTVLARHDETGDLAAITQVLTDPDAAPAFGFQGLTAVLRGHRGHRLGLLVKVAMIDLLAETEPQVDRIETDNAGSNEYMIAINAKLGFEVSGVTRDWELDLTAAS
jgi:GNAT superfamily N-acetyltransferase